MGTKAFTAFSEDAARQQLAYWLEDNPGVVVVRETAAPSGKGVDGTAMAGKEFFRIEIEFVEQD